LTTKSNQNMSVIQPPSALKRGNTAFRDKDYIDAIRHYISALQLHDSDLTNIIIANLRLAQSKYSQQRSITAKPSVAVCGAELSNSTASRVYTIAKLYQPFADVEIIGTLSPKKGGGGIWQPIRDTAISKHTFLVDDENRFIEHIIELVVAHPYDIVHLSKPLISNVLLGLIYKTIWGSTVLVDIDTEESDEDNTAPINIEEYIQKLKSLPDINNFSGSEWTEFGINLARHFDGITVTTKPLQKRYGGNIIYNARDEKNFLPSPELKKKSRNKFDIPLNKKVVLFFGTPSDNTGLLAIAETISTLKQDDILFVIAGNFPEPKFKKKLLEIQNVNYFFIDNQPFECMHDVLSIGDVCVLLQDQNDQASQFYLPAKLTDALAMALPVLIELTPSVKQLANNGAVTIVTRANLCAQLQETLQGSPKINKTAETGRQFFLTEMSQEINSARLLSMVQKCSEKQLSIISEHWTMFNKALSQLHPIFDLAKSKVQTVSSETRPMQPPLMIEKDTPQYQGKIEAVDHKGLRGWVVDKNDPAAVFSITLLINGTPYSSLTNSVPRGDLKRAGKSTGKGGVSELFPPNLLNRKSNKLTLRLPDGSLLPSILVTGESTLNYRIFNIPRVPLTPQTTIIVPIYNAPEDLDICIDRLLAYTPPSARILLINDASTDPQISSILRKASGKKNLIVLTNPNNLGFTKTVNRGITEAGKDDVVLLNSDARVTPRWLEGLRHAASSDARIGTVTPMSDRAGAFSAPLIGNENDLPEGVNEIDYAISFRRGSQGLYPVVPTGNGFCLYIKRLCLEHIGILDEVAFPRGYGEENDFCMRARQAGWINIVDDRTYVYHDRGKSFKDEKTELIKAGRKVVDMRFPDYVSAIKVFSEGFTLKMARFRAQEALEKCKFQKFQPRRILFVIATKSGGTPQTNGDLMRGLGESCEPWLLHSDSQTLTLSKAQNGVDETIHTHVLTEVVEPLTHRSVEYDRVLTNWLFEYDFDVVHIRHLAWQSISLPRIAQDAGATVVFSFHDYYTICPTVKLLDGENRYCGGVCSSGPKDCSPDLWKGYYFPKIRNGWVSQWRARFDSTLKYCDCFVTTSESAKATILKAFPFLAKKTFHVIPHGRDFEKFYDLANSVTSSEPLRILVPGNISDAKGMDVIKTLLKMDTEHRLSFHILGKCSSSWTHARLSQHGPYERDRFHEHVKDIRPHIGAMFSIWNETWCHTLTELWSIGLPVAVFDYGTISQRMHQCGGGWVFDSKNITNLYKHLVKFIMHPELVTEKRHKVLAWQKGEGMVNNVSFMASKYDAIYRKAESSRRFSR
jgi:GT2 family glycosyltransferase/glycosyltransferase involved in cell wall biosynthesis